MSVHVFVDGDQFPTTGLLAISFGTSEFSSLHTHLLAITGLYPHIKFIHVDVNDHPDVTDFFDIISIPTLVLVKEGKTTNKLFGENIKHIQAALDCLVFF